MRDITPDFLRIRGGHEGERCHVIYVTASGMDYCRETLPLTFTAPHTVVASAARHHFNRVADRTARDTVSAFRVEWF